MATVIDRDVPIPAYYQLKQLIKEQIQQGQLQPGDRLPTEAELCEQYNLSRTPVRQALQELVFEGLLIQQHPLCSAHQRRCQCALVPAQLACRRGPDAAGHVGRVAGRFLARAAPLLEIARARPAIPELARVSEQFQALV